MTSIWPTWGDKELKIQWGTFIPPKTDDGIIGIKVLPVSPSIDVTNPQNHSEVLQQAGLGRDRIGFTALLESLEDYYYFLNMHKTKETKLFNAPFYGIEDWPCILRITSEDVVLPDLIWIGLELIYNEPEEAEEGET